MLNLFWLYSLPCPFLLDSPIFGFSSKPNHLPLPLPKTCTPPDSELELAHRLQSSSAWKQGFFLEHGILPLSGLERKTSLPKTTDKSR